MAKNKKLQNKAVSPTPHLPPRAMSITVTTPAEAAVSSPDREFLAPATIEPLFWRPRFLIDAPALLHAPFLFWLCNVVQPRAVAVLGVGDGAGHFALCQALDKLNIPARCDGYGFWSGFSDGNLPVPVPGPLSAHETQFYDDLSALFSATSPDAAIRQIREDSLDLLYVDLAGMGAHDTPDEAQYEEWFARLKPNGILIMHAVNAGHHLLDQPRIEFRAGQGLALLTRGTVLPPRLQTLLDICDRGAVPADVERIFQRLGKGLALLARDHLAEARLDALRDELEAVEAARKQQETIATEVRAAYDQRNHKLAELQTKLFDAEHALKNVDVQTVPVSTDSADALQKDFDQRLAAERQARVQETTILTRKLEESAQSQDRQLAENKALHSQLAQLQADHQRTAMENARLRAKIQKLDTHLKELLGSASWRITSPMRRIKAVLKR